MVMTVTEYKEKHLGKEARLTDSRIPKPDREAHFSHVKEHKNSDFLIVEADGRDITIGSTYLCFVFEE